MTVIRYGDLPHDPAPSATNKIATDGSTTSYSTLTELVNAGRPYASQAEAEAGASQVVGMNPLRTAQAISALGASLYASVAQGALAATAVQPAALSAVRVPAGGSTGQVLGKVSAADNDVTWQNAGAGDLLASNNLSDLASIATARSNLGLAIGTNVQAWDADLDALAANGTPGTAGKALLLKSTVPDVHSYLKLEYLPLAQYDFKAANTAEQNDTILQGLANTSAANTAFLWPPETCAVSDITVWQSGHQIVGQAGSKLYSTARRPIKFVGQYSSAACSELLGDDAYFDSGTATVTIASPGVVTWVAHKRVANDPISFTTTGALPTGMTASTVVFVKTVLTADTFTISATAGGAAINTSGSQSGVHTVQTRGWLNDGGDQPTFSSNRMVFTAQTCRRYKDITVAINAPLKVATSIFSGTGISLRLYEGAGTTSPIMFPTGTCTISIASPGVVTYVAHGLLANDPISFSTTGALPTGLTATTVGTAGTTYYVKTVLSADTFTVSATAGGAVINTTGSQSGVHTLNGRQSVVSTRSASLGYVKSTTGTVRVYLYSAGAVTSTIDYVNAQVAGTSYWQGIRNLEIGQVALSKNTLIQVDGVAGLRIENLLCDGTPQILATLGNAATTCSYIDILNVRGIVDQLIAVPFVRARNGVNLYIDRMTARPSGNIFIPGVTDATNVVSGRALLGMEITYPAIWDENCLVNSDTFNWYDGVNMVIKAGPNSEATGVGPCLYRGNVLDSCRRSVYRFSVGTGTYLKELTLGDGDTSSCFEGDAIVLTGAGEARAPVIGSPSMRIRSTGRYGFICDIASVAAMSIAGTYHDVEVNRGAGLVAAALYLTGNSNWDGVTIDGFIVGERPWNDPGGYGAPYGPKYGLVIDGASGIQSLVITPNNRFYGSTTNVVFTTQPDVATSIVMPLVGRAAGTATIAVTASPATTNIAASERNRSIFVKGGTVSTITVGGIVGALTSTNATFFLPARSTASVTHSADPVITALEH